MKKLLYVAALVIGVLGFINGLQLYRFDFIIGGLVVVILACLFLYHED